MGHFCPREKGTQRVYAMKLSKKSRIAILIVFAVGIFEGPLNNLAVLSSAQILEQAQAGSMQGMLRCGLVTFLLYVVGVSHGLLKAWTTHRFYNREMVSLRDTLLGSILHRPAKQARRESDAYYLNLFNTDVETYRTDYLANRLYLFNEIMWIFSAAGSLFFLNPWLCVAALVSAVVPFLFQKFFANWVTKAKNQYSKTSEVYNGVLKETLEGYEAIRADNHTGAAMGRFHEVSEKNHRALAWLSLIHI